MTAVAVVVLLTATVVVVLWWAGTRGLTGKDLVAARLDALRVGLSVGVGGGGVFALYLAWRRQRSAEADLNNRERALIHQLQVAVDTKADAEARRITDLYTKAVEQLGSEKAPVRLGGLYALERLAQDHIEQRQTIVNVLCAYLRMPYTLPGDPPTDDADDTLITAHRERIQEREVRLAAQRILAHHLRPGDDPDDPVETFWTDIDLDLTGATLINLSLTDCTTRAVQFGQATFTGNTDFRRVTFTGNTDFDRATFTSYAGFDRATFTSYAGFIRATFTSYAGFFRVTFTGNAGFFGATFTGDADFRQATFTGNAGFDRVTFTGNADFTGATLPSTRWADFNTPSPWTDFAETRFERGVPPLVARFVTPPDETDGAGGDPPSPKQ